MHLVDTFTKACEHVHAILVRAQRSKRIWPGKVPGSGAPAIDKKLVKTLEVAEYDAFSERTRCASHHDPNKRQRK